MGRINVKMCVKLCSEIGYESISAFKMSPHTVRRYLSAWNMGFIYSKAQVEVL